MTKTLTIKKVKTFEPKLIDIHRPRKTHDTTYIIRRLRQYNPQTKSNTILKSRNIGYVDKNTGKEVYYEGYGPIPEECTITFDEELHITSAIPKTAQFGDIEAKHTEEKHLVVSTNDASKVTPVQTLFDYIFESLTNATPLGVAISKVFSEKQKNLIKSLAEYNLLYDNPANELKSQQLSSKFSLLDNVAYEVVREIGADRSKEQTIFEEMAKCVRDDSHIIIDSTSVTSYSKNNLLPLTDGNDTNGHNENQVYYIYSLALGIPISYRYQDADLPNASSLSNMLKMSKSTNLKNAKLLIKNGYSNQDNLAECLESGVIFTTPVEITDSWVTQAFKEKIGNYENLGEVFQEISFLNSDERPAELAISRENEEIGIRKECTVKFAKNTREHSLWLYFFQNLSKVAKEENDYYEDILELREKISKHQILYKELTTDQKTELNKCYDLLEDGEGYVQIKLNREKFKYYMSTLGIYVIVSTEKREPHEIRDLYLVSEEIEKSLSSLITVLDKNFNSSGQEDSMRGLELCRLLTVGYKLKFIEVLNKIKSICRTISEDSEQIDAVRKAHKTLLEWLNKCGSLKLIVKYLKSTKQVALTNSEDTVDFDSGFISQVKLFIKLFDKEMEKMRNKINS